MTPPTVNLAFSFADPTNPNSLTPRLRKRIAGLGRLFIKLAPKITASTDEALRPVIDQCYANWLTAKGLVDAAEALINRRAVDMLIGGNKVEIEIAQTSMKDVRALSVLTPLIKQRQTDSGTGDSDEPEYTLVGKGRFGCLSPDPDLWFVRDNAQTADPKLQHNCPLPSFTVELSFDFNSRTTSVQELLRLADATLTEAEREMGETRARLCHDEGEGSCNLF